MFQESGERVPQREQRDNRDSIGKFLMEWYRNVFDDRHLLFVLEKALSVIGTMPTKEPISLDLLMSRLNADEELPDAAKELIPYLGTLLGALERGEKLEVPSEKRAYKITFAKEVDIYDAELMRKYYNEESGFDASRSDMLDLIYDLCEREQDEYAFIERRADIWPQIIRSRIIERAKEDARFSGKSGEQIEKIIDEVLPELHRRTLKRIKDAESSSLKS